MCFKFFLWEIIFSLSNEPYNNNISILESKITYFCLRSNFCEGTTLRGEIHVKISKNRFFLQKATDRRKSVFWRLRRLIVWIWDCRLIGKQVKLVVILYWNFKRDYLETVFLKTARVVSNFERLFSTLLSEG